MTCREKLEKEYPECSENKLERSCPYCYGYLPMPEYCEKGELYAGACTECWNREIPETEEKEKKMTIYEKVFGANFDEGVARANCPSEFGFKDLEGFDCDTTSCIDCWKRPAEGNEVKDAKDELNNKIGVNSLTKTEYVSHLEPYEPVRILDSGNRREFETGAVRDIQEGKGRCDLAPLDVMAQLLFSYDRETDCVLKAIYKFQDTGDSEILYASLEVFSYHFDDDSMKCIPTMLLEVSKHFEDGAKKYGENNWQKGIPVHCYIDSAVRHYLKFLRGDKDEPHDRAFVWNLICCIWTCKHKPELNEYRKPDKE